MGKGMKTRQMGKAWEIGSRENPTKSIVCGETVKLVLILFLEYGCFFSIRFTFYGIVHNLWNTWAFSSISQSMRKCSEIHRIRWAWEIGTHFFPQSMGTFLPSYAILYHMGNAWFFPSIFNSTGKCSKIHPMHSQVVFP